MSSFLRLSDEELVEVYTQAITYNVSSEFIELLLEEIEKRNLN
jgi:hypothetical protein